MQDYVPYFYIIQNVDSGKYYAGCRYQNSKSVANPSELLKEGGYYTSSKPILKIKENEGPNSFVIRKIKVFDTAEDCLNYETRFLKRVDAKNNDNFYNMHNNDMGDGVMFGNDLYKKSMKSKYGVEHASQSEIILQKKKELHEQKYGVKYNFQRQEVKDKIKSTNIEKYGSDCVMKLEEFHQKSKNTMLEKYGVEHALQSPEILEKLSKTVFSRYGVKFAMQDEQIKLKARKNQLSSVRNKYGVDNVVQVPEIRNKIGSTVRNLQNRKIVDEIRLLKKKMEKILKVRTYVLPGGKGWTMQSDEVLENIKFKLMQDLTFLNDV